MEISWVVISYVLCITIQIFFCAYALLYTRRMRQSCSSEAAFLDTAEGFATARGSQGRWRIAWSFFAGSMGAWAITSPPNYAVQSGWVGMVSYAVSCGIPTICVVTLGGEIQARWPQANSLADFVSFRFGKRAKGCVMALTMFNMVIGLLAELTTIGALFKDFVGAEAFPIVLTVAVLSTTYTLYGGLVVSIVTDQLQALFSIVLIVAISIWLLATFHTALPPDFGGGQMEKQLGSGNPAGLSSLFVMPLSLTASTLFSEAVWQRVWAAEGKASLRFGAAVGASATVVMVFLFGLAGFIAAWGGLVDIEKDDPNLYLFQVFKTTQKKGAQARVDSWIEVMVLVVAAAMNEGAIDSAQNGLISVANSCLPLGSSPFIPRLFVIIVTVPVVFLALQGYQVLSIFLITNMACTCVFPAFVFGAWDTPLGRRVVTEAEFLSSIVFSMTTVTLYGIARAWKDDLLVWDNVTYGMWYAWAGNEYLWDFFAVAAGSGVCGIMLSSTANSVARLLSPCTRSCGSVCCRKGSVSGDDDQAKLLNSITDESSVYLTPAAEESSTRS
mmetsp:Transcript_41579/g.98539  ORF Transcript_41579/g.98539 Transcript_41579/m.98539 type:complete len:556 (+) Transcript_41579:204-1871(+)